MEKQAPAKRIRNRRLKNELRELNQKKKRARKRSELVHNLVYIRYRDHLLFRNSYPGLYKPAVRECVGWVVKENRDAVWILNDRCVKPLPHERTRPEESGLVILKNEILKMKKLAFLEFTQNTEPQ